MSDKLKSIIKSSLVLLLISVSQIKSDEICEAIIIDAITTLQNGTIVIFRRNEVWIYQRDRELLGPCPISGVFEEMSGPVDAALTITSHESITEFIGSSVYFENGNYFTYRNLGRYNVEWGALVYLPHKGLQSKMGSTSPEAKALMKTKISAAYFDPTDGKSKLVFSDGTVLAFTFELGAEYDTPILSSLDLEFKKYGFERVPSNISAALTLTTNKVHEIYLFVGSKYCSIKLDPKLTDQSCDWKYIKEGFLNCDKIIRKNGNCGKVIPEQEITVKVLETDLPQSERALNEVTKEAKNGGIAGRNAAVPSDHQAGDVKPSGNKSTGTGSSGHSLLSYSILSQLILNYLLIIFIQIFC